MNLNGYDRREVFMRGAWRGTFGAARYTYGFSPDYFRFFRSGDVISPDEWRGEQEEDGFPDGPVFPLGVKAPPPTTHVLIGSSCLLEPNLES